MITAEIEYTTLVRSFLIALLVVTPYGIVKVRQVRAARRARDAHAVAAAPSTTPSRPRLEDVVDRITSLAADPATTSATITVPDDVTVAGSTPPPGLVDTLVRDALRRSGLIATAEIDTADGRVIEFRRSDR